jgi:hypothetical protein
LQLEFKIMDRINFYVLYFEWKNEIIIVLIPILIVIFIGILVLRQFNRNARKLNSYLRLNSKNDNINKVIQENTKHEKLLNILKEIINSTIRSRSIISRVTTELINLGQLIQSGINLKEQDIFIISQLYDSISKHRQEFEKWITDNKYLLSDKSLDLILKEQNLLLLAEQDVNDFIKSYKDRSYLSEYSELVKRIDLICKETAGLYQKLNDIFQEELNN